MKFLKQLKGYLLVSCSPLWAFCLKMRGVSIGRKFVCIGRPGINRTSQSQISLGDGVTLCNTGMANPLAEGGRCRLSTVAPGAKIILGDRVGLSSSVICAATKVEIGEGTIVGGGALIIDTDFHHQEATGEWGTNPKLVSRSVIIGKHCFIGARATILKGVTIGDHAVVGASAVVSRSVAANTIVAGNPAKPIGNTMEPPASEL